MITDHRKLLGIGGEGRGRLNGVQAPIAQALVFPFSRYLPATAQFEQAAGTNSGVMRACRAIL